MAIHILSDDLAAKIAAGEVIERPSSVVKELIENSIDAGATEIQVSIRGGGQRLIRVADNGTGIPSAQVPIAFASHATSKIESVEDLFHIRTLGFRGEALSSIGAVARVTLMTHARGEESGTEIHIDGGRTGPPRAAGAGYGTIVTVEDLFHNVPARLKFLKTPATEAGHVADLINAYALAYPQLRFTLTNEGRQVFMSPGSGQMFDTLVKVFGVELAEQMLSVSADDPAALVEGYVSPPSVNRSNRKLMLFFINHRWVQDRTLQHAVISAYHTSLMVGRSPIVALNVIVPPESVDVNVHPTKAEVRFRDLGAVFNVVQRAVRGVMTSVAPIPSIGTPWTGRQESPLAPHLSQLAVDLHRPFSGSYSPPVSSIPPRPTTGLPMLRVLGQIASTYVIAEGPEGLYLIDQHAAHERVLYEQLRSERQGSAVAVQELLDPTPIELTLAQSAALSENQSSLASVGFRTEPFGNHTVLLRSVPAVLKKPDPRATLIEILEEMQQGEEPLEKDADARLISSVCKSIAVKGGQVLALDEMRELVRRLEQATSPRTCPHGRPTVIQLNLAQLEREFGRK